MPISPATLDRDPLEPAPSAPVHAVQEGETLRSTVARTLGHEDRQKELCLVSRDPVTSPDLPPLGANLVSP